MSVGWIGGAPGAFIVGIVFDVATWRIVAIFLELLGVAKEDEGLGFLLGVGHGDGK